VETNRDGPVTDAAMLTLAIAILVVIYGILRDVPPQPPP
jgi:hypothetical protein